MKKTCICGRGLVCTCGVQDPLPSPKQALLAYKAANPGPPPRTGVSQPTTSTIEWEVPAAAFKERLGLPRDHQITELSLAYDRAPETPGEEPRIRIKVWRLFLPERT